MTQLLEIQSKTKYLMDIIDAKLEKSKRPIKDYTVRVYADRREPVHPFDTFDQAYFFALYFGVTDRIQVRYFNK